MTSRLGAATYNVKVDIHDLKDLRFVEAGKDILPNPYVEVEVCGQKKYTAKRQQASSASFNSQFNFTVNLARDEFTLSTIEISVFHAYMFSSGLIGGFVLSFSHVYGRPQHWIFRQWVALRDPDKPAEKVVRRSSVLCRHLVEVY